MMLQPSTFKPTRRQDFIGPARDMARVLESIAARADKTGAAIKTLIRGEPGIGKSELLNYLQSQLGATKWSVTKINGTDLKLETIDQWQRGCCLTDMFGDYRVLRIEEVDKANRTVQARMLTLLDDLPSRAAVLCTSNQAVEDFEPRFQSRFQVFNLAAPAPDQVKRLLSRFDLSETEVNRIATFSAGNVRLALFDAQSALDEMTSNKRN